MQATLLLLFLNVRRLECCSLAFGGVGHESPAQYLPGPAVMQWCSWSLSELQRSKMTCGDLKTTPMWRIV